MVVSPLWREPSNIAIGVHSIYCSNTKCTRRFRCEDNKVSKHSKWSLATDLEKKPDAFHNSNQGIPQESNLFVLMPTYVI